MKRSEMINLMTRVASEYVQDRLNNKRCDRSLCDHILTKMEEAGMLPPETTLENAPKSDFIISKEYFDEPVPNHIVIGWDEE